MGIDEQVDLPVTQLQDFGRVDFDSVEDGAGERLGQIVGVDVVAAEQAGGRVFDVRGETVVVGATGDDDNGESSGAA